MQNSGENRCSAVEKFGFLSIWSVGPQNQMRPWGVGAKLSHKSENYKVSVLKAGGEVGNQSIYQYLPVHKDSSSNLPSNRRLEEAVFGDCPNMMKFKAA
ncbi:hypothetical protein AVEN_35541-1 [Araneus ventricosus]|uniref:Uncharacterized protein n=1 Tax=Araneus ventricosus TaxID=182803 RepID=A0A4Y2HME4_ARAVE|nr:hypothetical protein AVEN_35541-1 [Araneus ventricosus]